MSRRPPIGSPTASSELSRPVRLSDTLYESILRDIAAGTFQEKQRLPTESALSERFGVSRPVVREALARLQVDGLVHTVQGSGTFVQKKPTSAVLKFAPVGSIADIQRCFEFRQAFEGETAYLAAERRSDADLAAIKEALDSLEAAIRSGRVGQDEDIAFHAAVTRATQNKYFILVAESIAEHTAFGIQLSRTLSLHQSSERLFTVQREHIAVYEAVREGTPSAARDAMRRHIQNARARIFEGA